MTPPTLSPLPPSAQRRPLVSVVMPTFRRQHLIEQSIHSVVTQTCDDLELLVRDDDPDGSAEGIVTAISDPRVHYHCNESRLGMPGNLNGGICDARGRFIAVCHDHDLYRADRLEKMVGLFEAYPSVIFVHTGLSLIDQAGGDLGRAYVGSYQSCTPGMTWLRVMLGSFACPVAADTMVRRSTYERFGLFDPEFGFISDVEMWMRLCLHGDAGYIADRLSLIREREAGHEYARIRWDVIAALACMHRRYGKLAHGGLHRWVHQARFRLRLERYVAVSYLVCLKRRDHLARDAGRQFIGNERLIVSRVLATVI